MIVRGKRGGNLEHQPSGLEWNIDNWMYVTYTNRRYRWAGDHIEAEQLPFGSGQWGVTHDDVGRNFFCTGGGENPAQPPPAGSPPPPFMAHNLFHPPHYAQPPPPPNFSQNDADWVQTQILKID